MIMFIEKKKMSKKKQKELNNQQRNTWGPINPVTRIAPDKTKYNRKRVKRDKSVYDCD